MKHIRVFISSTYLDLKDERKAVREALSVSTAMKGVKYVPVGMEDFPAADKHKIEFIKEQIDTCDYFVLIIKNRYGTIPEGKTISYPEQEYDYAIERKIPILVFIYENWEDEMKKTGNQKKFRKLRAFVEKVDSPRQTTRWSTIYKLTSDVINSLNNAVTDSAVWQQKAEKGDEQSPLLSRVDPSKKDQTRIDKHKRKVIMLMMVILLVILLVISLIIFIPPPPPPILESPTVVIAQTTPPTITNTPTAINTSTPTNTPTPTNTSTPTNTPEPTPNLALYQYKIGVFGQNSTNCTKKDENLDKTDQIVMGLNSLGFNATKVAVKTTNDYDGYDVLYMPYGWSCMYDEYDLDSIRNFLNRIGTGLLIGDPIPNSAFTKDSPFVLELFESFSFEFYQLTSSQVREQTAATIIPVQDVSNINDIFDNLSDGDLPRAESYLYIGDGSGYGQTSETYRRVLIRSNKNNIENEITCLMSSWEKDYSKNHSIPRYIIIPGSEYKASDYPISDVLMIKIILWLAHAPID